MKKIKNEELNLVELATKYGDADKARELLESMRWPEGPVCPHCKSKRAYRLTPKATSSSPGRKGLCKCKDCRKQFTVTVGTIFADSHIPLGKWLIAVYLLCSSKKAMSAHQLHRMLGITYKSAWFMAHRIRYCMTEGPLAELLKGTVEVDETYIGGKTKGMGRRYTGNKTPVVALVQRDGKVRTRVMACVTGHNLKKVLHENVDTSATIMTDDFRAYRKATKEFEAHETVNHSAGEYARGNTHTNTVEGFFSLLKRGVVGSFHHVSKQHLHRYCDEFAFRWSNRDVSDGERMRLALKGIEGRRLTYLDSSN